MSATLVTVRLKRGEINRVPRGETPVARIVLQDNERLMDVAVREVFGGHERKTVDWTYTATIAREELAE